MKKNFTLLIILSLMFIPGRSIAGSCTWLGGYGNWSDPTKWSTGQIPGSTDSVYILKGNSYFIITFDVGSTSIAYLQMTGGTITGNGDFFITGDYDCLFNEIWNNSAPGIDGSGTIHVGGVFHVSGRHRILVVSGKSIVPQGGAVMDEAQVNLFFGAHIRIDPGKTIIDNGGSNIHGGQGNPSIINYGTLIKRGSETSRIATIRHYGNARVEQGQLQFRGLGYNDGGGIIDSNAVIDVLPGAQLLLSGTNIINGTVSGAGHLSGNIILHGGSSVTANHFVAWEGYTNLSPGSEFNCDTVTVMGAAYFEMNTDITTHACNLLGGDGLLLYGNGNLTVNGAMTWTSAQIQGTGTITVNGPLNLNGDVILYQKNLMANGGGTWTNPRLGLSGECSMELAAGQTVNIVDATASQIYSAPIGIRRESFINNGTITIAKNSTGSEGMMHILIPITHTGTISAGTGTRVFFERSGEYTGARFNTATNSVIRFGIIPAVIKNTFNNCLFDGGGTIEIFSDSAIFEAATQIACFQFHNNSGFAVIDTSCSFSPSSLLIDRGVFRSHKDFIVNTYTHNGGLIAGKSNIIVSGNTEWNGGELNGVGDLTANGPFNCAAADLSLNRRGHVFINGGGVWTNPRMKVYKGANFLVPYGKELTINCSDSGFISNADGNPNPYFANYGTMTKAGSGKLTMDILLKNGRILTVAEGILDVDGPFNNLNLVQGNGTIDLRDATVTDNGTLSAGIYSTGILNIEGNYNNNILVTQVKNNSGPGSGHDLVIVSDSMHLSNTLRVQESGIVNDTSFVIMRCNGGPDCRTGTFSVMHLPPHYSVSYTGNEVWLSRSSNLLLTRTSNQQVKETTSRFRIVRFGKNQYRIETDGGNDEVMLINLKGQIIRKINVNQYAVMNVDGLAAGIYVGRNNTTGESGKIIVE